MHYIIYFLKLIRTALRDLFINSKKRKKLKNDNFTLISSDCSGGMIYHDLKKPFLSPTINMFLNATDYLKFIKKMNYYLYCEWVYLPEKSKINGYPTAKLDDIVLHLVHYKSFEEAKEKWDNRKKRIIIDNIYYIMNDRNDCTEDQIIEFNNFLQENNKMGVIFTHQRYPELKYSYYIDGFNESECVGIMTQYINVFSIRLDKFNWIDMLNKKL